MHWLCIPAAALAADMVAALAAEMVVHMVLMHLRHSWTIIGPYAFGCIMCGTSHLDKVGWLGWGVYLRFEQFVGLVLRNILQPYPYTATDAK